MKYLQRELDDKQQLVKLLNEKRNNIFKGGSFNPMTIIDLNREIDNYEDRIEVIKKKLKIQDEN